MSFFTPKSIDDDSEVSALMQGMVERLAREKWITGRAFVSPKNVSIELTDLGRQKVQRLAKHLKPFEYHLFEGDFPKASAWQKLKLMLALRWHGLQLWRPALSTHQESALTLILMMKAAQLREAKS